MMRIGVKQQIAAITVPTMPILKYVLSSIFRVSYGLLYTAKVSYSVLVEACGFDNEGAAGPVTMGIGSFIVCSAARDQAIFFIVALMVLIC